MANNLSIYLGPYFLCTPPPPQEKTVIAQGCGHCKLLHNKSFCAECGLPQTKWEYTQYTSSIDLYDILESNKCNVAYVDVEGERHHFFIPNIKCLDRPCHWDGEAVYQQIAYDAMQTEAEKFARQFKKEHDVLMGGYDGQVVIEWGLLAYYS